MNKALIVDDSSTVRLIIAKMLKGLAIESVQAVDGLDACKVLSQNPDIQIAFVDWNMPVMSGIQFVETVRANNKFGALKIIMVTTETEMHQVATALEAGVDEYIMKPFTEEMFKEKIALLGLID